MVAILAILAKWLFSALFWGSSGQGGQDVHYVLLYRTRGSSPHPDAGIGAPAVAFVGGEAHGLN